MIMDGCTTGIVGVVRQESNWKMARITTFYSAKLNSAQQNYPVHRSEMLAGIEIMLQHQDILQGVKFNWITTNLVLGQPSFITSFPFYFKQGILSRSWMWWDLVNSQFTFWIIANWQLCIHAARKQRVIVWNMNIKQRAWNTSCTPLCFKWAGKSVWNDWFLKSLIIL